MPAFTPVSKIQAVERDIAVLVGERITHAALMQSIASADTGGLLQSANLFDIYRPKAGTSEPQERSFAVRLTLGAGDATLTELQIEAAVAAVLAQLGQDVGARQRA